MKITKENRRAAKKLFRDCVVNGQLDEKRVRDTVTAVATSQPRGFFGILAELERLTRVDFQKRTVTIESAAPLQPSDLQEIESKIRARSKSTLSITHTVNPSLLGGLRIKIGSDVWDGSVAARLEELRNRN